MPRAALSRVFVTDWRSATPETRYFTIDNYLADLNVAVDELGPPVDLIGLCQGGWLALVYAARFPKKVRRLVLVGAPIDIAAAKSPLSHFVADVPLRHVRRIGAARERASCMASKCSASGASRTAPMKRRLTLQIPGILDPARRRELIERFRQWYAETIDLPGSFYPSGRQMAVQAEPDRGRALRRPRKMHRSGEAQRTDLSARGQPATKSFQSINCSRWRDWSARRPNSW